MNNAIAHHTAPLVVGPGDDPFLDPTAVMELPSVSTRGRPLDGRLFEVHMKAMLTVLFVGAAVSVATSLSGAESIEAYTPFAVLSTGVLLLAYWVVAGDHTPAHTHASYKKAA